MLNPLPATKWNYACAAHLYNRAGFGGTPSEIETLQRLGPEGAVAWFVDHEKIPESEDRPDWAKPDPSRTERVQKLHQMARQEMSSDQTEEQKRAAAEKRRQAVQEVQRDQV